MFQRQLVKNPIIGKWYYFENENHSLEYGQLQKILPSYNYVDSHHSTPILFQYTPEHSPPYTLKQSTQAYEKPIEYIHLGGTKRTKRTKKGKGKGKGRRTRRFHS